MIGGEGRSERSPQVYMWQTSTMLIYNNPEPVLSIAEAGMIRIRLLEQARLGREES